MGRLGGRSQTHLPPLSGGAAAVVQWDIACQLTAQSITICALFAIDGGPV